VDSIQSLRKLAEEMIHADETMTRETLSPDEAQRLQHELRVCQIDLKMQNEELLRTQGELEALRKRHHNRYFNLYDLAPVGYFTLSEQGLILEANLSATTMLGVSRGSLVKHPLSRFILPDDLDIYHLYFKQSVETGVWQAREMRMLSADGSSFWAHLQAVAALDDNDTPVYWVALTDIDQRKQAEVEVRREKALLRCLIDSVGDLIFIKDMNGVYKACNKASEEFIGVPECEQIGKTDFDFFDRDMAETIREHDRQILASGKESRKEEWVTYQDGRRGLLDTLKAPFYGPDGEQLGLVGISRDISDRKRVEDALRESEERFRTLCESAPIGIFLSDSDGNNIYCNPRWEEITGMSAAEGRGKGWRKSIHPDDHEEIGKIWHEAFTTGRLYCHEHRHLTPQGETIWVRALATPVKNPDGTILGHVGTVEDITELKRSEMALKQLNNELENRVTERTKELAASIVNLQVEICVREIAEERVLRQNRLYAVLSETNHTIVHTRGRDTLFNDICRIAVQDGCFELAWVGLVDEEGGKLKIVAAKGATGYLDDISITANEELAGLGPIGISIREGSYYICNDFLKSPITRPWHERGRAHGIRASASIALKQEGQVIGALTLYADEKDFFDQQQVALLQQMGADVSFALDNFVRETRRQDAERALLEETAERLRAMEFLREKDQMLIQQSRQAAMGEMIGNIAHQWRQPLNVLGLTIQQLLLYYDFGELTREFLDHNVSSSMELIQHMSKTIDDFRNYFSPDKEKVEFKVGEAIVNTLSLLEGSLQNPKISIEIVTKGKPVINGYQNEFAQVLLNILINARDAFIEREIDNPRVTITTCSEDGCAVVTVADNAGGIPEEIMGKIFDPYFSTKGPQRGTGIGLFMSKSIIVKNMGGRLAVRNIANGAEFRIEVRSGIHI